MHLRSFLLFSLAAGTALLRAQTGDSAGDSAVEKLPDLVVSSDRAEVRPFPAPQTVEVVTAAKAAETINVVDVEDTLKYLPSIFLRKRNYGDTQPVMATRTWGVSSSARSLVYADGVLLTALIANNNNIGAPRWGLVAPAEIERIELLYGPFSAGYPGNSLGAVLEITTRMPEKTEASLTQIFAWQRHRLYGTDDTYGTSQTALTFGTRRGPLSVWLSGNFQDSHSQPLSYVTSGSFPAGTTGGYAAVNKLGAPANILGSSGLLHTQMANLKLKAAYDLTPTLRAAYTFGWWQNDANSHAETYLRDASGNPTYAGQAGFATGTYHLLQEHSAHSLSLKSDTKDDWDFEAVATLYHMDKDRQRSPTTAAGAGLTLGTTGRVAVLEGTHWSTLDLKARWQPGGKAGAHLVTFGAHDDHYRLFNPTYNTSDWAGSAPLGTVVTEGDGKTRTDALWLQDAWSVTPAVKLTVGGRYEDWKAYDGYNVNGATTVVQPSVGLTRFSPKAVAAWTPAKNWTVTASLGRAYRFPTAAELYQLVSTGTTFTSPTPDLKPDNALAAEFRIEHVHAHGRARLSFFQDDVHDAIISQFKPLVAGSTQLFSYLSNVDHVRSQGVEFSVQQNNLFIPGLEVSGSVTYLDARTLTLSGAASASTPAGAAVGKFLPNIPRLRSSFVVTYRPDAHWAFTAAGRSSSRLFTTLDDADTNPNNYQGFAAFFVADVRVHYQRDHHWSGGVGIDNVLNREYFLFHPFPQRTLVVDAKYAF